MLYGLLKLSFWGYIAYTLILTHITIVCVTVYLHRSQAHQALDVHPVLAHFFRLWLWLTTGMTTRAWVAIHRKHHAKCETPEDPHSPQVKGIRKVLWEGAELYRVEAKNEETLERYGKGAPNDWLERKLYTRYTQTGIFFMLLVNLVLLGMPGLTVWAIQMAWIPFFAAGVVNGIGHYWGYRNFECPDAARNILPFGLLIGGEELHNNHHTFPTSAKFSIKKWEFDLGWMYIRLLHAVGLVKIKRVAPQLVQAPSKLQIDMETVKAVISNRFQLMSQYTREVLLPLLYAEKDKLGITNKKVIKQAKYLLICAENLLDEHNRKHLAQLLAKYQSLALGYQYREKLQALWERATATQKELLDSLQEWCRQAETSGVLVLKNFASRLPTLTSKEV